MRESPAWPRITLGGGVERSRATDAASSEAIGTPAEPLGLLSRVATGPLHGGRATQRGLTGHYVINAVGKFNAQRRHRIDPVKDCASHSSGSLGIRRNPSRLVFGQLLGR